MADVTAPQFQQDVNNAADWANGDENTTVTMRLGQQADSPAKVIKRVDDLAAAQREDIYEKVTPSVKGTFEAGFTFEELFERGKFGTEPNETYWAFTGGSDGLPHVVTAGTDPTLGGPYVQVTFNSADNITTSDSRTVQEYLDDNKQYTDDLKERINPLTKGVDTELNVPVYIVYGQSLARGSAANTPGREQIDAPDIYWSALSQSFEPISYTMEAAFEPNVPSTGNCWPACANRIYQQTGLSGVWIQGAIGGKNITELSKGAAGEGIYEAMKVEFDKAMTELSNQGITPSSYNVIILQGESDQSDGTTWDEYNTLFSQLLSDMRTDFNVDNFFVSLVGNPQSRTEESWNIIRNAQEYVVNGADDATVAYSDVQFFTQQNGLLRSDGVHPNQRGCNRIGRGIADSMINALELKSATGSDEINFAGYDRSTVASNKVESINAVIKLTSSGAEILTRDNNDFYISSNATSVNLTSTEVQLRCEALRNYALYDIQVSAKDINNPSEHIDCNAEHIIVGDNKVGISVRMNKDFSFTALTTTGSAELFKSVGSLDPIDLFNTDSLDISEETGYVEISHNTSNMPVIATTSTRTGAPNDTQGLKIAQPSNSLLRLPYDVGYVNLFIPSFTIRPNSLKAGTEIHLHISAKASNQAL